MTDISKRLAALEKQSSKSKELNPVERISLAELLIRSTYITGEELIIEEELNRWKQRLGEKNFNQFVKDQEKVSKEAKTNSLYVKYIDQVKKQPKREFQTNSESGEETKARLGL